MDLQTMKLWSKPKEPWLSYMILLFMVDKSQQNLLERKPSEGKPWDLLAKINAIIVTDLVTGPLSAEDLLLEDIPNTDRDLQSLMKEETETMTEETEIMIEETEKETLREEIESHIGRREETMKDLQEILIETSRGEKDLMKEEIENLIGRDTESQREESMRENLSGKR